MSKFRNLVENLNDEKVYFVVGHKMTGYEKAVIDYAKKLNKKFEVNAIIPKAVSEEVKNNLYQINSLCWNQAKEEFYEVYNFVPDLVAKWELKAWI